MPADLSDQIADGPFSRRDRRTRGHLFFADDAERLHLRERAYRRSGPRFLGYADRAFAPRQRKTEIGALELFRLWRDKRDARVQARRRLNSKPCQRWTKAESLLLCDPLT